MGGEVLKNILSVHYLLLPGSYLFDRFVPLTKLEMLVLPCLGCWVLAPVLVVMMLLSGVRRAEMMQLLNVNTRWRWL